MESSLEFAGLLPPVIAPDLELATAPVPRGAFLGNPALRRILIWVGVAGGLTFVFLACARSAYGDWLRAGRSRGRFSRRVLVIGSNDEALDLCHLIESHPEVGYRVCGLVGDPTEIRSRTHLPCLGS